MSEELYNLVVDDVRARVRWETRQGLWYEMRNDGLRRKKKPWPNAADLHFPLVDTTINKLKPSYFQQAMGLDVLATFVPMRQQLAAYNSAAEKWFTYKLLEKSNYPHEVISWIDHLLLSGRAVMKLYWDTEEKQLSFQAIDPVYVIVPPWTKGVDGADRVCQVMPMSLEAYKRAGIYDTSKKVTDSIVGGRPDDDALSYDLRDKKERREGITYSLDENEVIVWEVYHRDEKGKWFMSTFSPQAPGIPLRDEMEVPFDHGQPPFVSAMYEVTDGGWYSPRGVCEMLAPFETALCKVWNEKMDSSTLFNKPLFRAERDLPNSANLRLDPGQILPFGIAPVTMPSPPIDFDKEMQLTQAVAEQRVTVPDYGINVAMNTKDRRTATEIESINAQSSQNMDLRLRLFRHALGDLYKKAWSLLLQFDSEDLRYRFLEDSLTLDPVVLHDEYQIEPRGGMDMVTRQMLLQQAIQRKLLFAESPWVNQIELDKSIIEMDDPSLVTRLITDPSEKIVNEKEDEQRIIPALLIGESVAVKPGENYQLRIGVIMDFLEQTRVNGGQISPQGQQAIVARLGALLNAMEKVDTNNARALKKNVQEYLTATGLMPDESIVNEQPVPPGSAAMLPPEAQQAMPPGTEVVEEQSEVIEEVAV